MQQGTVAWSCGLSRPPWGIILEQCSESEEDLKNWDVVLFFFFCKERLCVLDAYLPSTQAASRCSKDLTSLRQRGESSSLAAPFALFETHVSIVIALYTHSHADACRCRHLSHA